jgi:hypothetical protein
MQDKPASVQKRIIRDLTASLKPVTPLPSVPVLAAGFVAAFLALVVLLIAMTDTAGLRAMNATQLIAVTAALAAGATLVSVFLVWEMIPGSRRFFSTPVAILTAVIGPALAIAILFPWHASAEFITEGWPCTLMGLKIAAVAAVIAGLAVWRGAVTSKFEAITGIGAFAGTLAVTVLQFQCPHQQAPHLLVWHLGSLGVAILTGIVIGWMTTIPQRSA